MNTAMSSARAPRSPAPLQGRVLQFFLLVFALSVPFWVFGGTPLPGAPLDLPVSALQAFTPLVAAAILIHREDGRAGVRRLCKRAVSPEGITTAWYAPMILMMPGVMILAYGIMRLAGMPLPEPEVPLLTAPVLFAVFFVGAAAEEMGWMGYAIDPMQQRWSALTAAGVLGSVWAVWHVVPLLQAGRSAPWIAWWAVSTVAMRILIVWLYNNTDRSVFAATVFHAMIVVANSLFPNHGSHYDPAVAGPLLAIGAAVVTFLWGPRTLARYRYGAGRGLAPWSTARLP